MTSVKLKFRTSTVEGKEGVIYYQIIHERVIRQIRTSHKVFSSEWNEISSEVIIPQPGDPRKIFISAISRQIKIDLSRLDQIIKSLDNRDFYSTDDVVETFERQINSLTLCSFMQSTIDRLIELRKFRTSETYKTTLCSFMRFRGGVDILLIDISSDVMMDYEVYLKAKGLTNNSISFYMRVIRAVYNRAVERELIEQRFPFKRVYTGVDKTVKRALPLKYIKRIKSLDLSSTPKLEFARDLFLFSFYTRGMSFVDMSYLRKKDLKNGIVSYHRRKTGQQLHIKWEQCMQDILDRHPNSNTEYLLPIIRNNSRDSRVQYLNMLSSINLRLKKIGEIVGLSTPLTHYCARHSWASIAKSHNIPISVISEGMGHNSEATTQIYLASLDSSIVDKANSTILKLL
ncbi:MAG: site-specific integrase [Rikenellaceae bacterium]